MTHHSTPAPFTIAIPDAALDDLVRRLRSTRWADDFDNQDWSFGVERDWLMGMADYWASDFDWRAQEAAMNRYPQFKVLINDVPVHFMHIRGKGPNPTPIVLTHGWPWTFWDYRHVLEPLTDPAAHGGDPACSFDVVIPSLPGFGFSAPLRSGGFDAARIAVIWDRLMYHVLGYERYGAAGGDVGAAVTGELAAAFPDHLIAILLTMPALPGVDPFDVPQDMWAEDERWMRDRTLSMLPKLTHVAVHDHIPQTLAYALNDSPIGLAAWIWQRRRDWSDCPGDLADYYGKDFLCTLASIYWLTNTIGTSMRWYRDWSDGRRRPQAETPPQITVPTGIVVSPKEVVMMPRKLAAERCNLQRWSVLDGGGHFAAAERPADVVNELRALFGELSRRDT